MSTSEFALSPFCEILDKNGTLHVGFGSAGLKFESINDQNYVYALINDIDSDRVISKIFFDTHNSSEELVVFNKMREKNLIVQKEYIPDYDRHHRDHLYYLFMGADPKKIRKSLREKTVCIVGCGGIGCIVAISLATAGVGKLILVDDDIVEIHNVSRQFAYTEKDIGKSKVHILADQLKIRNNELEVDVHDRRASFDGELMDVPRSDFVVLAADERGIIPKANKIFVQNRQPFMHICYINDVAVWGPLVVPQVTGCWGCQQNIGSSEVNGDSEKSALLEKINSTYTCPIISPVSLMATSMATLDILKFLTGISQPASLNQRVGIWTNELRLEKQNFAKNPECRICS